MTHVATVSVLSGENLFRINNKKRNQNNFWWIETNQLIYNVNQSVGFYKSQFPGNLITFTKKSLMENFGVFCSISCLSFVNFEQICALIQTLNHLAKQAKCSNHVANTYLYGAIDCVFIMSPTYFKMNLYSIVAWMSRNTLPKTGTISEK